MRVSELQKLDSSFLKKLRNMFRRNLTLKRSPTMKDVRKVDLSKIHPRFKLFDRKEVGKSLMDSRFTALDKESLGQMLVNREVLINDKAYLAHQ